MSYMSFPPEVNSARMYSGAGSMPMFIAAGGWDGLAAELATLASSFEAVISAVSSGPWTGPASESMVATAVPYLGWLTGAAGQAEAAAGQARAAATAFEAAQMATVHPAAVAANRVALATLVATNIIGQNTPSIAATEFDYGEMWAQDVVAMLGYHAQAASVATTLAPFAAPPTGLSALAAGADTGLTGLLQGVEQGVIGAAASSLGAVQSVASVVPVDSLSQLVQLAATPVSLLLSPLMSLAQSASGSGLAATAGLAAEAPPLAANVPAGLASVAGGGAGPVVSAGLGQAHLVGSMSVPPTWSEPSRVTVPAAPAALASDAAVAGISSGTGGMPMMPMPMGGGAGAGMPGGMMGRGGAGSQVVQQRPSVIPRVGVG